MLEVLCSELTESKSRPTLCIGVRISALEMRVERCEQTAVGGGCCWISVHDTAVEVFVSEVTPAFPHLPDIRADHTKYFCTR